MNVLFWILQVLLALHTVMGGVWKFTNPVQTAVPNLASIPNGIWVTLGVVELAAAAALLVPFFNKGLGLLIVIAAVFIVAEMLLFTIVHLASGHPLDGSVAYWLVVAAFAGLIAWGRLSASPL